MKDAQKEAEMIKEILEAQIENIVKEEAEIKFVEMGCGGLIILGGSCGGGSTN